ncbi:MAG: large repetitive protein, partial [Acidimicrobiaceae bacterium]
IERDFGGAPVANTWYPVALANARFGSDLDTAHPDISSQFNSSFSSWYLGTDGNPGASQYDLETIIVHELAHGLGFIGSTDVSGGVGSWGVSGFPFAYDRFTENGGGTSIISGFTNGSTALGTQLTSGSVFFNGPKADTANGSARPQLFAPSPWQPGSSYSHLDETAFPQSDPNSLMTPFFSTHEVHHAPGPIVLGVMGDMGWTDLPGIDPSLFTAPSAVNFGTVFQPNSGDATVVITNIGGATLTITSSTAPSSPFSATMPTNGTTLAGGKSLAIPVHFVTTTPGYPTGSLSLQTSGGNVTVPLSGAARSHTGTQAYVISTYKDFLNRMPSPSELSNATAQLDGGTVSPTAFVNQLANSTEWVNVIVTGFYQNTLGRPPDSGGLSFWTNAIRNGTYSVAQVAAQFYSSAEYYSGIGGGTDSSWVNDLYNKLLNRPGDAPGINFWVSQIPKVGRVGVVLPFYQSSESAHRRVFLLYGQLLGRAPDQGGWDYWAGQVVSAGDISLATSLATSLEYYNRAQFRFP